MPWPQYFIRMNGFTLRPIQTHAELVMIQQMEQPDYQDVTPSQDQMLGRWQNNPDCFLGLFWSEEGAETLIGHIRIYPISSELLNRFRQGEACYDDIWPLPLAEVQRNGCNLWYIGSMIIDKSFRKPTKNNPIGLLLAHTLNAWADSGTLRYPINIYTTGLKLQSQAMLRRFGFKLDVPGELLANKAPLYVLNAESKNALFEPFVKRGLASGWGQNL